MKIINTQTGKTLFRILGGEGLTLDEALELSGMEPAQTNDTGETVWLDDDGEENWYDDMVLVNDDAKAFKIFLPKPDGTFHGVKMTAPGKYIGCYIADNDEPDAWEIAEQFSDEVGTMKDARWSDNDTICDENGDTRIYAEEED